MFNLQHEPAFRVISLMAGAGNRGRAVDMLSHLQFSFSWSSPSRKGLLLP